MKTLQRFIALLLLSACTRAPESTPHAISHSPSLPPHAISHFTSASAVGVVKTVDSRGGRITIAHGPVESLKWSATTRTFRTGSIDTDSLRPGDNVTFEFTSVGMQATITSITRQPRRNEDAQ
ncbi:copper-binding protein [Noviluteimonas dokdonensis]|uniref:copper-binding protein n=1 Tax=Noviluteimonas dokdonensis TaxID=414050 RepID=UPI000A036DAE